MRNRGAANPICHKCGGEVMLDAGGFIARADLEGRPDMLFVVYCQGCGEQANALAQERGTVSLTPLSEVQKPSRRSRSRPLTRRAGG